MAKREHKKSIVEVAIVAKDGFGGANTIDTVYCEENGSFTWVAPSTLSICAIEIYKNGIFYSQPFKDLLHVTIYDSVRFDLKNFVYGNNSS